MKRAIRSDGAGECRDEWLVAESVDGKRTYLVHARRPRFVGQVFDADDPAGLDSLSLGLPGGQSLAAIVWFDAIDWQTHPADEALVDLARRAGQALSRYDRRLDRDVRRSERDHFEEP